MKEPHILVESKNENDQKKAELKIEWRAIVMLYFSKTYESYIAAESACFVEHIKAGMRKVCIFLLQRIIVTKAKTKLIQSVSWLISTMPWTS